MRDSKTPLEANFENDDIKTLIKCSSTIHTMKIKNYKLKWRVSFVMI